MKVATLALFLSAVLTVKAAPTATPTVNNTLGDINIGPDEALIILNDGESIVMPQREVEAFLGQFGVSMEPPDASEQELENNADSADLIDSIDMTNSTELLARDTIAARSDRGKQNLVIPLSDQEFLDWDIPMSTVLYANQRDATVALAGGQMVADAIMGGGGFTLTLVPDFLTATGSGSYTKTTTALVTGTVTFTIPANNHGVIVSRPWVNRRRGMIWSGRPGNSRSDYWQADSYNPAEYNYPAGAKLKWVKGIITTCLSPKYPIARCHGKGDIY